MKVKVILLGSVIFMFALVAGCSSTMGTRVMSNQYGSVCSKKKQCEMVEGLKKYSTDVYTLGDNVSIVMKTNQLFSTHETVLSSKLCRVLDRVAELLACYQKISVKVVVYYAEANQKDLARMRAFSIQHYLSKQKVNARLLYTVEKRRETSHFDTIEILTSRLP